MKETRDWTGYVKVTAEPGQRLIHTVDWTEQPIVASKKDRRGQWDQWIGPGILAIALTYVGLMWLLTKGLGALLGDRLTWLPPLAFGCLITIIPFFGILAIVATTEKGLMTPLGYWRWFCSNWSSAPSSDSGSDSSDSWSSGDGGGGGYGGGGSFGGGGGGASW